MSRQCLALFNRSRKNGDRLACSSARCLPSFWIFWSCSLEAGRARSIRYRILYRMSRTLRRGIPLKGPLDAAAVKRRAKELGADLCGIASAQTLNAFPPDPRWPQTPDRISPFCKSVIVVVQRIPAGAFRCKSNVPVQYLDMLVLRRMDRIALKLAHEMERAGHPTFTLA